MERSFVCITYHNSIGTRGFNQDVKCYRECHVNFALAFPCEYQGTAFYMPSRVTSWAVPFITDRVLDHLLEEHSHSQLII